MRDLWMCYMVNSTRRLFRPPTKAPLRRVGGPAPCCASRGRCVSRLSRDPWLWCDRHIAQRRFAWTTRGEAPAASKQEKQLRPPYTGVVVKHCGARGWNSTRHFMLVLALNQPEPMSCVPLRRPIHRAERVERDVYLVLEYFGPRRGGLWRETKAHSADARR